MSPHRVMSPHRANWLRLPEIFLIHWRCKLLLILIVFAGSGNIASAAGDLALGQPAFASSQESGSYAPLYAIDGNPGTRWASKLSWADNEWIYVDLGAVTPINRVVLNWEVAYGEDYLIRVSNDANNWTTVYTMSNGNGGIDDMSFATRSARYVLMQGIKRGTPYGYSLWDFEVYGSSGEPPVLTSIAVSPTSATVTVGDTRLFTATGLDQFGNPMATTVNWSITPGTGAGTINGSGLFTATVAGSVTVTATDTNNSAIAGEASASVVDAPVAGSDLALGQPAFASSQESGSYATLFAVDGDPGTRWASKLNWADNEWIYVDLGAVTPINRVVLNWEVAYGQSYLIRVSDDALNWTTVVNETNGNGGIDDMSFATESARYVLMQGIKRGTPYGYSLWDFEVYGDGGTVSASAVVTNMPAGGSVEFEIGGAACGATTEVSPGLFTSNCGNPGQGDYYLPGMGVRSTLRNNSGGIVASDENTRIGVAGNSYITVGDSLTEGIFDLYPADNQSLDGRIIGKQGFQARLNDLLTTSTLTNTLFNEAVGGDKTPDTLTRIDSILERHPGSNRALMMLGTNDSGGSTPLSSSQYKDNMQLLANRMIAQGNEVWISLLPPALPYSANLTRNGDIEGYNAAIKTMSNIQIGPDFFTFFYNDNDNKGPNNEYNVVNERVSLYYDNVHPNALGSRIMSILWANSLKGTQIIPFVLDRLCNRLVSGNCNAVTPSNHKQNLLGPGNEYYIDETYTLNSVPAVLADGIWILPANAESDNTDDNYIEFTIDRPVTVYVAYDDGASSLPDWLDPASPSSDFTDAFLNIQTTDPLSSTLHVYSQTFSADAESPSTVSLGGNMAAGAIGANSNYLVIVVEQ